MFSRVIFFMIFQFQLKRTHESSNKIKEQKNCSNVSLKNLLNICVFAEIGIWNHKNM